MLLKLIPIVGKTKVIISLFVIFSCSVLIVCCANEKQEFNVIIKGLESCSNVISIYKKDFTSANFSRLQNTLNEFNHSMANYLGAAGKHLKRLNALNNSTKYAYSYCVELIDYSCKFITEMNDRVNDPDSVRFWRDGYVWEATIGLSYSAARKANASLSSLKYLKHNATELKKILDATLIAINKDFGPEGFYVKNNQLSGRVILKKRSLCKKINTARAIIDRFNDMDIAFYEDMNNLKASLKLYELYDENSHKLLMGNTSLRNEVTSKFGELVTQSKEYKTWYQSNHETLRRFF